MYAQTTASGGLAGVVTDRSHAVIPDADIAIKDSAKGSNQSTKTDHDAVYQFFFLPPGRYTLTVRDALRRCELPDSLLQTRIEGIARTGIGPWCGRSG